MAFTFTFGILSGNIGMAINMFGSKFKNLLLEVVLDLLHPIIDLQVNLWPLKMVPNNFPFTKT